MARDDQRMRLAPLQGKPWDNEIDYRHTQTMKRIIGRYGSPGEKLVGVIGAQAQDLAYITDRICVGDGAPRIYDTQLEYPTADQDHVDERRAAVGLSSLAEYLASSRPMLGQAKNRGRKS